MDSDIFVNNFYKNTLVTLFHLSVYLGLQLCLFSQFKYNTGGKLDAANYITARACTLIKQVTACHHSSKSCRDEEISIPTLPLQEKRYGSVHEQ